MKIKLLKWILSSIYKKVDRNNDGKLDKEELGKAFEDIKKMVAKIINKINDKK